MAHNFNLGGAIAWTISVLLLATVYGCPAAQEKATPSTPSNPAQTQNREAEPIAASPMPVAEFQQPPALPPNEPLPKPELESFEPLVPLEPLAASEQTAPTVEEPGIVEASTVKANVTDEHGPVSVATHPLRGENRSDNGVTADKPQFLLAARPQTGKNSNTPFDPIKENGPIFENWPKPKAAIAITGMEAGYLEPCGCAGLDRMKGGMGRRYSMLQQIRRDGWPLLTLDVGGLAHGFGRQAELKFQTLVDGKRKMGYDAIAFGMEDLRLPAGEIVAAAAGVDNKPSPFVAANVGLFGFDSNITPRWRIFEIGGMKIGVTAVLGKEYQQEINNPDIEMSDPEAALNEVLPQLAKADSLILLAHTSREEALALAKKYPQFRVVVCSDGHPEPPKEPETLDGGKTLFITVGQKGMNAIVLGLYDKGPVRYQRVPLDSRFAIAKEMKQLMGSYQEQLKIIGFAGLGLRPVPHPLAETNGRFVGSEKCTVCHEKSHKIWRQMGHSKAYETLAKLDPPRNFDPECVSCHVTGWHPTKFFPYESGFESPEKTPLLLDTGCENCHGPGEKHIAAEIGANKPLQEKMRQAMVATKADAQKQQCLSCHDIDNSPEFNFDLYWPFVEHYEKEEE